MVTINCLLGTSCYICPQYHPPSSTQIIIGNASGPKSVLLAPLLLHFPEVDLREIQECSACLPETEFAMREVLTLAQPNPRKPGTTFLQVFEEMLALWENQEYADVATDYATFEQDNPSLADVLHQSPCVTWILDLRTGRFCFMSQNTRPLLGHDPALFTALGLPFVNDLTHPDDLLPTWKLIRKIWDFLLLQPPGKRKHYRFNHDYRLAKADGSYLRLLEQCSVLQQDSNGNITHVMGVCSDITHLKKSETLTASLISTDDNSCIFFTPETDGIKPQDVLSKRELEIVKLIAEGYSSKLIADKLCIGFSTVNTHRQNIIRKTNTRNTGEFVQFAVGNGLI